MREQLIRYLLGELDEDEFRDVQSQLKNSPELRRELAHLRECFAAHQDDALEADGPPSGLAARTAGRVAESDDTWDAAGAGRSIAFRQAADPPAGILGWSLADLTVAGGVMLAVSMLLFPALRNSLDGTRMTGCQNNMKIVGEKFASYAENHGTLYPRIGLGEPAGMFAAHLIARGYISADDLAHLLICPGSRIARQVRSGEVKFQLPTAEQLQAMTRRQLLLAAAAMSPCYNYRFPYQIGNEVYHIRDDRRALSPVLCDIAGDQPDGSISPNHGGRIVQILFADGSVRTLTTCELAGLDSDMFHNDEGKVALGLRRDDIVLGRSDATPILEVASPRK